MNTPTEIQSTVCDFGNLYRAMLKCKKNVMWKDSVAGFVKNGLVNCYKLKQTLEDGSYTISPYTQFKVFEPKERDIVSTRIKDRVFQRSLCDNYLYDTVAKSFIYDNCACQYNKGTTFARDRLVCHLQRHYRKYALDGYVIKCDLSNYFGSTPHSTAIEALNHRIPDDWAMDRAAEIVKSFNQGVDPTIGMGLGSQVTQLVELAVLDDFDHYIKEQLHIKGYIRYMDDFILIHPDKQYLEECRAKIESRIVKLGLTLSKKKTQLFPITQPIRFLGFSFRLTSTGKVVKKMLPEKVSRERRKLRKLVERAKAGYLTKADVDECFESWKSHARYGDTYHLILRMEEYYKSLWRNEQCSSINLLLSNSERREPKTSSSGPLSVKQRQIPSTLQ